MAAIRGSTLTRLQIASLAVMLLVFGAALFHETHLSSDASFLTRGNGAVWIGYPFVPSSDAIPVLREDIPATTFTSRLYPFAADSIASSLKACCCR